MSDTLNKLYEERARLWEAGKSHLDAAGTDLSAEADATWSKIDDDLTSLDKRIAQVTSQEKRAKEADAARSELADAGEAAATRQSGKSDNDVLRAMVRGEMRAHEFRDLTKSLTTAGGHTVPTSFYGQLVEHMIENSAIRMAGPTVLTTDKGEDIQIPKTTTHPTAILIAEGGTITESDPVFGQVTLGAYKYGFSTQVSSELEQDSGVDLSGYLARIGGEALGNGAGADFVVGNGSAKPNGVANAASVGITGATSVAGVFTADNLIDLYYSVTPPYRRSGTWMMADAALKVARKLKDGDSQYLWVPGLVNGEESTLLGRPVVNDTNVADPQTAQKSVLFGDFSRYFIRDVRGVRVERSVDYAFNVDLVTWRFLFRTDGDLIDTTGAIKYFIGGAS